MCVRARFPQQAYAIDVKQQTTKDMDDFRPGEDRQGRQLHFNKDVFVIPIWEAHQNQHVTSGLEGVLRRRCQDDDIDSMLQLAERLEAAEKYEDAGHFYERAVERLHATVDDSHEKSLNAKQKWIKFLRSRGDASADRLQDEYNTLVLNAEERRRLKSAQGGLLRTNFTMLDG